MSLLDPKLFAVHAVFVFVMGCVWGSFFNVVIWRVPRRFSIVTPGSHCPSCGTPIAWYDNIPLLSQLALARRCRSCGVKISWRYFGVELLTGLLYLGVFLRFGVSGATLVYIIFASLLLIATFTDIDHWIIPDSVSLGGLGVGMIASLIARWLGPGYMPAHQWPVPPDAWWSGVAGAALGAGAGWLILQSVASFGRLLFRREAMGGGDIVLMAMFGTFIGWQGVAATLILACFIGVAVGGSLLLIGKLRERWRGGPLPPVPAELSAEIDPATPEGFADAVEAFDLRRKERELSSHLPFGPYLCSAALLVVLFWPEIQGALILMYGGPWMNEELIR